MEKLQLTRKFILDGKNPVELPDPDPSMSPTAVLSFYSNTHPELVTSTVIGPVIKEDKEIYTFKTAVGTKG